MLSKILILVLTTVSNYVNSKMPKKIYCNFFILCAILSQGVVGTFLKEDIGESSNVRVREKRVINRIPGEDMPVEVGQFLYVVNIKKNNHMHCIGTILARRTVITAANCVDDSNPSTYSIISGSTYTYRGDNHYITNRKFHGYRVNRRVVMTGIALIIVNPPFEYSRRTSKIELHVGPTLPGMEGFIAGWGTRVYGEKMATDYRKRLRSIEVPIMDHSHCVDAFRNIFEIKYHHICTYHEDKQCGITDAGAPLVINGELAGIHLSIINPDSVPRCNEKPDIFELLQDLDNSEWIRTNIID